VSPSDAKKINRLMVACLEPDGELKIDQSRNETQNDIDPQNIESISDVPSANNVIPD